MGGFFMSKNIFSKRLDILLIVAYLYRVMRVKDKIKSTLGKITSKVGKIPLDILNYFHYICIYIKR